MELVGEIKRFKDLPQVDKKIIEGVPWAQEMWKLLKNGLDKTFLYWCQIVLNMGECEDILEQWVRVFMETYEESCCELVCDMEHLHSKVLEKIQELLERTGQLCKDLKIEMPIVGNEKLNLYQEQYQLKKHIEEYEKQIKIRQEELRNLQQKQLHLCNSLGQVPKVINDSPLPSAEEIGEFQRQIEKLESEKFNRLEKFISIKEELLLIIQELDISPSSQFEEEVFSTDDSAFLVTDSNMKQLDYLKKSLHKQLESVKEEIAQLREKVDEYWNFLELDWKEKHEFCEKYEGNSVRVLEALRMEVKRCEGIRKANIKVYIDKLRNELNQIWEKCHCTDVEKRDFGFFYADCYNDDLLELHEVELRKWKRYYEDNKELLTLLEKHKRLWNKMMELEENATGPNRYNNRGGQLLKEEKDRNKLAKLIPQIEDSLVTLSEKYERHYNRSFTTYGETIVEYISKLHEDRENMKKQKLSARKMQREKSVLTPAKSPRNLFPSTSRMTPMSILKSATKRKLATPLTEDKKRPKTVLGEKNDNKSKTPIGPIPSIKVTVSTTRSKRLSVERKKRINKLRRLSAQKEKNKNATYVNDTLSTDYGAFQDDLSNRDGCRSTIIPMEILSTPSSSTIIGRKNPANSKTPTNALGTTTSRTPGGGTPVDGRATPRGNKTPDNNNTKLSRAKSNLKLIF